MTETNHAGDCPAMQAWDVPGACDCGGLQQPFGGEMWKQSRFPYMECYIVTGGFGMGMASDPRQRGSTLCWLKDGKEAWTQRSLASHLNELDYVCCGQLYDILLDWKHPGHFDEMAAMPGREPSTRRWKG